METDSGGDFQKTSHSKKIKMAAERTTAALLGLSCTLCVRSSVLLAVIL